ncbi:MAG: hypothetical protein JXA28_04260 [Bacteroidetes bacterium]|nr:hypothetical protein [Bacteroidota bacterium]
MTVSLLLLFGPVSESAHALSAPGVVNTPQHRRQCRDSADVRKRGAAPCDAPSLSASGT